jgi:phosphatidylserine/phosphatidylglycerophosphate/cardiolipin synthase-like enzyme
MEPMRARLLLIISLITLLASPACQSGRDLVQVTQSAEEVDWYSLYFTHPGEAGTGLAVESALVDSIESADENIELAMYSFSLPTVADALIAADERGVNVRMVMETDNMDSYQVKRLLAAGIPVKGDSSDGLMHNKFVIIDDQEVWTGSLNLTITGAQEDANNLIRLASPELAVDYAVEFEAMYTDDLFGEHHRPKTPYPLLSIDGTVLEAYFPPNDGASKRLIELINEADESVIFMASNFTSDPISQALLLALVRGVKVGGIMDADNALSDTGSDYQLLVSADIPVMLDKDPGRMHHKVFIFDNAIVAFGSYNFTASAEKRNDENLLIIHDPDLAARFLVEYQRLIE